jgi:hypothetical protein
MTLFDTAWEAKAMAVIRCLSDTDVSKPQLLAFSVLGREFPFERWLLKRFSGHKNDIYWLGKFFIECKKYKKEIKTCIILFPLIMENKI